MLDLLIPLTPAQRTASIARAELPGDNKEAT
jgi:hypothetical protein